MASVGLDYLMAFIVGGGLLLLRNHYNISNWIILGLYVAILGAYYYVRYVLIPKKTGEKK